MTDTNNSYLTFHLGDELFAINVSKVLEIKEYSQPKSMPQSKAFLKGVIEYDSEVIPLIDARLKFGMEEITITDSSVIVVLQLINHIISKSFKLAILVDAVSDVKEVDNSELKIIADDYKPQYIHASFTIDNKFVYLLDPDVIFDDKEVISMMEIIKELDKKG